MTKNTWIVLGVSLALVLAFGVWVLWSSGDAALLGGAGATTALLVVEAARKRAKTKDDLENLASAIDDSEASASEALSRNEESKAKVEVEIAKMTDEEKVEAGNKLLS